MRRLDGLVERFGWAFPSDFRVTEDTSTEVDTQELTMRAHALADAEPSRRLFSAVVLMEMNAGRITPDQAAQYIDGTPGQSDLVSTLDS